MKISYKNYSKRKKLRVFLGPVNYGTQAGVLASRLRDLGVYAKSITDRDPLERKTDQVLERPENLVEKIASIFLRISYFFRFNTFIFFYGRTLLPRNLDLPFYRIFGKKVVMEYLGWDVQQAVKSIKQYKYTNARYYKDKSRKELADDDLIKAKKVRIQERYVDTQIVCAPYLSEFVERSELLPLAIPHQQIQATPKRYDDSKILRILHAPTHKGNKGTEFIERALEKLQNDGYLFDYTRVENISHAELQQAYQSADIFIDQVVSGWYGTASIEAMAKGCPTICFLRANYSSFCPYYQQIPIINADPDTLRDILKRIIQREFDLEKISADSITFIRDVHSDTKVAAHLLRIIDRQNIESKWSALNNS